MKIYNGNEYEIITNNNKKYNKRKLTYTGTTQVLQVNPGIYKLECWGAQGGTMESGWTGIGGYGGYACGTITLTEPTTLYINIGQQGQGYNSSRSVHYGGWNGGGYCYQGASGGGGATDIRINSNSLYARVIVAGGGGGSNDNQNGGAGGGEIGGTGVAGSATNGEGGQQTRGGRGWLNGEFGQGAGSNNSYGDGGAGGGGWYGGGKANGYSVAGGGGSGYVYTEETAINYPSGCLLDSRYYLIDTKNIAGQNTGNGRMSITKLDNIVKTDDLYTLFNDNINDIINFDYSGRIIEFTLPRGRYLFECWGAGGPTGDATGGNGAYTKGILTIYEQTDFNCMVGALGSKAYGGWTGPVFGNNARCYSGAHYNTIGGGATDFGIGHPSTTWDDITRLRSRIMVAAGGGGSGTGTGCHAGELNGVSASGGNQNARYGQGATQTAGGAPGVSRGGNNVHITLTAGVFGSGGNGSGAEHYGGGGSAGWYGGGGSGDVGGGTGSCFISGYPGCNAITQNGVHTNQPIHYSGLFFEEPVMLGYAKACPNPRNNNVSMNGNNSNGYARITILGYSINTNNCMPEHEEYFPSLEDQYINITIPKTLIKDGLIYYFNKFKYSPDTISIVSVDKYHYQLIIPANADYDIEINAIFDLAMRINSDIYKNVHENIIDLEILEFLKE